MNKIEGVIKLIRATQQVTDKFSKREFVISTLEDVYPQDVILEFTQDKCSLLDLYKEGQLVLVDINIRGREWVSPEGESRFFNTLQAWRINLSTPMTGQDQSNGNQNTPASWEQ